jgi:hypothetical protein
MNLPGLRWNTLLDEVKRWKKAYLVIDIVTERLNGDKEENDLVQQIS